MTTFTLRDLESADRSAVVDLLLELNRFEDAITGDRATDRKAATACLQDDVERMRELGGMQLLAEREGRVVGYICCAITQGGPFLKEAIRTYGYVTTLVVTKDARKIGIGEALMQAAERFTRAQGLRSFAVGHLAGNTGADKLYERLGLKAHAIERVKWLD
ncbi:MAG: GNAT family N-acetyltransferase [Bosea sp. (in: a-proteobacteria)]